MMLEVTLTLGGTSSTGGVVSPLLTATVTVCVQDATLPLVLSVAVQVMMVVPPGNGSESDWPSLRVATTSILLSDGFVVGVPIVCGGMVASQLPSGCCDAYSSRTRYGYRVSIARRDDCDYLSTACSSSARVCDCPVDPGTADGIRIRHCVNYCGSDLVAVLIERRRRVVAPYADYGSST